MAISLVAAGWQVEVVTVDPALLPQHDDGNALNRVKAAGVNLRYTGYHWSCFSGAVRSPRTDRRSLVCRTALKAMQLLGMDDGFGWVQPALESCRDLQPGDIDVVLATGSPFFSFQIAQIMGQRLRCPYVLDYRDLWSLNPHNRPFQPQRILERRWLKDAARVLFVSRGCLAEMARWTGSSAKMSVIANGFDSDEYSRIEGVPGERPVVIYAGRFYPPERTPTPILQALRRLHGRPDCPVFHYYGSDNAIVEAEATHLGIMSSVVLHGITERSKVLEAIKYASAAVVITTIRANGSLADQGIVTAKLFEPLGLKTPVLLITPHQSDARSILEEVDGGRAFTGDEVDEIASFLLRLSRKQDAFSFAGVDRYSWRSLGERLSETLKGVCRSESDRQALPVGSLRQPVGNTLGSSKGVSIVIPLYNKIRHIQRAIDSVLTQTYQNFEVIVIDDGSTDGSASVVGEYTDPRIRLLTQTNAGVSDARNRGIQMADHELVAFLDADDEWLPCFLETVMGLRTHCPGAGMYTTAYRCSEGAATWRPTFKDVPDVPEGGLIDDYFLAARDVAPFFTSTVMVPKHVLNEVGLFPSGISHGEDLHTWARIAFHHRVAWSGREGAIYHLSADKRACDTYTLKEDVAVGSAIEEFLRSGRESISPLQTIKEYLVSRRLPLVLGCHMAGKRDWALRLLGKIKGAGISRWRVFFTRCLLWSPACVLRSVQVLRRFFRRTGSRTY